VGWKEKKGFTESFLPRPNSAPGLVVVGYICTSHKSLQINQSQKVISNVPKIPTYLSSLPAAQVSAHEDDDITFILHDRMCSSSSFG